MKHMRNIIFIANLLFSISLAITTFANSNYIENTIGASAVGGIYALSALFSIFALSRASRTIAHIGSREYFFRYGAIHALSLLCLVLPLGDVAHVLSLGLYLFSINVLIFSLDIIFEHVSGHSNQGKTRGIFLLLGNIGWVFGPLLTAKSIDKFGYTGMYGMALILFAFISILVSFGLRKFNEPRITTHHSRNVLVSAFKKRIVRTVIIANFILQFFYAIMTVYMPIYLFKYVGLSWDTIGIIFAIMLTAFVILDYPLGKIADKIGSEKELAAIGFLIMSASTFGFAYINTTTVIIIGALLFFSRVGAATVEAMTEIHFFKLVGDTDPSIVSIFRDLRPLAYIVAPLIAIISLSLFQFKMIFAILGTLLFVGFIISLKLEKDSKWWVREHQK